MRRQILSLYLLVILAACTNNAGTGETAGDSTATEAHETPPAPSQQVSAAFPALFHYFRQQDPGFLPGKFEEGGTSPIDTTAALAVDKEQMTPFYPYLLYNSDSTYAIDLYSYNYVITKRNDKVVAEEGGPDTEVAVVDLKAGTRKRVFFGGTSTAVFDAKWIGNKTFFLAVGEMMPHQNTEAYGLQPGLLLYDMALGQVKHFVYPDTLQVKKGAGYKASRLPGE